MKTFACALLLFAAIAAPQSGGNIDEDSPRGVVQKLWKQIESGSLATKAGLRDASSLFSSATAGEDGNWIIYSDDYSVSQRLETTGDTATVEVGYAQVGVVDPRLRFIPPPQSKYYKTSLLYHVVHGKNGWKIVGAPRHWLTVHAALEELEKFRTSSRDHDIKVNAERTIAILEHRH